jgi:hypothetical protein
MLGWLNRLVTPPRAQLPAALERREAAERKLAEVDAQLKIVEPLRREILHAERHRAWLEVMAADRLVATSAAYGVTKASVTCRSSSEPAGVTGTSADQGALTRSAAHRSTPTPIGQQ